MANRTILLAYSGGLDTSVCIKWLQENHKAQVATLTVDLGMVESTEIKERALGNGAASALVIDGRETFLKEYVLPALKAGAIYEGQYPLATALSRPLIARYLVEEAKRLGAKDIAHGCTGKGNDQVRIDVSIGALSPDINVIAPVREWQWTREEELQYAKKHDISIQEKKSRYSIDENLWGRSVEAGDLEDPWKEPPEDAFAWTNSIDKSPNSAMYLEIGFEQGCPVSLDNVEMSLVELVSKLNSLAGTHGVGRVDHVENRLVGIKSREVYEAPAALVLHHSHKALESITLSKEQIRMNHFISQQYADMVYNGLWYTSHRNDLEAYVNSNQRYVTGSVRIKLHKGNLNIVGRKSARSLYKHELATYEREDAFDHKAAEGFISIYGLPVRTYSRTQGQKD